MTDVPSEEVQPEAAPEEEAPTEEAAPGEGDPAHSAREANERAMNVPDEPPAEAVEPTLPEGMGPTDVQYETGNTLQAKPSPTNTRQSSGADMTALKVPGGFETAAREAAADEAAEAEAAEEEAPVEGA